MTKLIFQICPFLTSIIRVVPLFILHLFPNIRLYGLEAPVSPNNRLHFSKLPQGPLLTCLHYHNMDVSTSSYGQVLGGHWWCLWSLTRKITEKVSSGCFCGLFFMFFWVLCVWVLFVFVWFVGFLFVLSFGWVWFRFSAKPYIALICSWMLC